MVREVSSCRVCGEQSLIVAYEGPIRSAGVDSALEPDYVVLSCPVCRVAFLDPFPQRDAAFYESNAYWDARTGAADTAALWRKLGEEQVAWLTRIGSERFVGARVADFGCGAGLFLDLVQSMAAHTIGVEPSQTMQAHLRRRGHQAVSVGRDILPGMLDYAVCFDTLEHVSDPLGFVQDIRTALTPGGSAFIGVPNQNDVLKELVPDYLSFFYHANHLFYFTVEALVGLVRRAGLEVVAAGHLHKYSVMNLIHWLRDRRPRGNAGRGARFDEHFEAAYRDHLERQGLASHVLIEARKSV